ncbi:MAG: DNA-processing protein DprA [Gammaproteobacteria bacterium]|nr:DNA-processing protein DprA [Gammaproteobacteria bacterium]
MTQLKYWLALNRTPYIGPVSFKAILETVDSPQDVFDNIEDIKKQVRLNSRSLAYLKNPDWEEIETELIWAENDKNHIITLNDDRYPQLLSETQDAPPLLYVHGNADILNRPQLAIVGSRNPSPSGKDCAFQFAKYLTEQNIIITSGLALGIDYESHRGTLASRDKTKRKTIAVIGTGLNRVYPAKHRQLAHEIVDNGGALVSEYPLDTPAKKEHFPKRNRIISGMSMGVLVVEAAQKSGSLITARYAGEQGREVFAIPGSIHNPLAKGCHSLIRQGAKLVEKAEHILEELDHITPVQLNMEIDNIAPILTPALKAELRPELQPELQPEYLLILNHLGFEPTPIDTVVERSGLTPEAVSSMLLVLELQDYVQSLPGGTYSRVK